jgi:hypothetical protein
MAVFWVVAPCSLVEVYQRFRGPCCLHYQGAWISYNALFQKLVLFPYLGIRKRNLKVILCLKIKTQPIPEMLCFKKTRTMHEVKAVVTRLYFSSSFLGVD